MMRRMKAAEVEERGMGMLPKRGMLEERDQDPTGKDGRRRSEREGEPGRRRRRRRIMMMKEAASRSRHRPVRGREADHGSLQGGSMLSLP